MEKLGLTLALLVFSLSQGTTFSALAAGPTAGYEEFSAAAEALSSSPEATYFRWKGLSPDLLREEFSGAGGRLAELRSRVRKTLGTIDGWDFIRHQRAVYARHFGSDPRTNPHLKYFDVFLEGRAGSLARISELSALLTRFHLDQNESSVPRTEFAAFVLSKGSELRVLAGFGKMMDGAAPPSRPLEKTLLRWKSEGWKIAVHLHSHPFNLKAGAEDWGGAVIPSDPDINAFDSMHNVYGLRAMEITNGLETLRIPSSELPKLPR